MSAVVEKFVGGATDFVGDVLGGIGGAVSDVFGSLGTVLPIVSQVAALIPGPWQVPAQIFNAVSTGGRLLNAVFNGAPSTSLSSLKASQAISNSTFDASGPLNPEFSDIFSNVGPLENSVTSETALSIFDALPEDVQQIYLDTGFSGEDIGRRIGITNLAEGAWANLNPDAQQIYLDAGYSPQEIGLGLAKSDAASLEVFHALPKEAQDQYLTNGFNPVEIGGALINDQIATGGANLPDWAVEAVKAGVKLLKGTAGQGSPGPGSPGSGSSGGLLDILGLGKDGNGGITGALIGGLIGGLGSKVEPTNETIKTSEGLQPYLASTFNSLTAPPSEAFLNSVLRPLDQRFQEVAIPTIQQGAFAAGQLGSSRQGVAQGIAARGYTNTVADTLARLGDTQQKNAGTFLGSLLPYNKVTTKEYPQTNPLISALGGALGGSQLGNILFPGKKKEAS